MTYVIKQVKAYQTPDGSLFLTWQEANQYQENIIIKEKTTALKLSIQKQLEKAYININKETVNIIFDILFSGNWLTKELTSLGFVLDEIEKSKPKPGPEPLSLSYPYQKD